MLYHKSCTKQSGSLRYTPRHNGGYVSYNVKLMIKYFVSPKKARLNFVSAKSSCQSIA